MKKALMIMLFCGVAEAKPAPQKAETHYDFDDDKIEGEVFRPESSVIDSKLGPKMPSLIRMRGTFKPELLKSVENI